MKLFITAFALIVAVSADFTVQTREDLLRYRSECASSLNIPEETVEKYKKWEFPEEDSTKCYIKCVFNKMHLFDDTTGPNVDNLVQQLAHGRDADEVRAEVVKCVDKNTDDNACHWAFRGFKCFQKNNLQLIKSSIKKD
ncbi:general odorant-binding protein 99a-like [Toxorhynchites rutilus septentrionalis]|uniref:general odorant-binding protein 99a-like n=1 Tax=Toxorhynchites rutilus septentrionalis TaxID=329112 RepID=UPI0024798346|nr:general odorant-binding protein 99a-like [Toxorhynchites rutilus septentrionalis]